MAQNCRNFKSVADNHNALIYLEFPGDQSYRKVNASCSDSGIRIMDPKKRAKQTDKFKELARKLGTHESEERFKEALERTLRVRSKRVVEKSKNERGK